MGRRQRCFIAATVAICALWPSASHAETERIALRYEAFAGCPKRPEFEARILAVTSKAEFSDTGQREFNAKLEQSAAGVVGSLEVIAGEERSTREVRGKTCDEVASALALVTALAVDPNALGGESPTAEPRAKPKPTRNTLEGSVRLERDAGEVTPRRGFVFSGGASAALKTGLAPEALPEGRAFLDFAFGGRVAPALRGTFELSPATKVRGGGISASFAAIGGALDASLRLLSLGDVSVSWFVGAELERVQAEAEIALGRQQTRLWSAAFSGPRLSLELPGLNYHSRRPGLFLELSGEAVLPLIRQEYFVASPFRGSVIVHKNPPFSMRGAASLGVRFL